MRSSGFHVLDSNAETWETGRLTKYSIVIDFLMRHGSCMPIWKLRSALRVMLHSLERLILSKHYSEPQHKIKAQKPRVLHDREDLVDLRDACAILGVTPDRLIQKTQNYQERDFEDLYMQLDNTWIKDLNAPGTRIRKWATIKRFFTANRIYAVRGFSPNINRTTKFHDVIPTRDECQHILETGRDNREKLLIALLIESLQRIGTISRLTWGDMLSHLEKNEDVFLVWIEAKRTKRNIPHYAPIGRLSAYFLKKQLQELGSKPQLEERLFPVKLDSLMMAVMRLLDRANAKGAKQSDTRTTRYEMHIHSFRKFGVTEMENKSVNNEVIKFLMGQKGSEYSKWTN